MNIKELLMKTFELEESKVDNFVKENKLVSLIDGEYVAKGKYETLESKNTELTEKAKKYDELLPKFTDYEKNATENEKKVKFYDDNFEKFNAYVEKEKFDNLSTKCRSANIKEDFIKFAIHEVGEDGNFEEWATKNPQYTTKDVVRNVSSNPPLEGSPNQNDEFAEFRKL